MKITMKKSFAVVMALVMCATMLFGISFSTQAATVDYVYSGNYIYNWGEREEVATFLSDNAIAFYEDNDTSYETLVALQGNVDTALVPSSELFTTLSTLMEENHKTKTSYDATKTLFQYTDCQNSGGKISSFYSGTGIGPSWDGTWNREHTWPNSKSNTGSDSRSTRENDIISLRPTATSENSDRGNTAYGESDSFYHPNSESGGTYDLRGDVARIMLFVYVRWGGSDDHDGALDYMWGSGGVMESKEVLLDWIEADPVDTWELGRNDSVESITGTRNVFVDYPELAFTLFGEEVPADYATPSGNAEASAYNITATTNNSDWGTVAVSGSYITATPATGYEAAGYEVVSGNATVVQNGNSFKVSATSDVTVQINFAARTQKTVNFNQLGTVVSTQTPYSGDKITLPVHNGVVKTGYTFLGWVDTETEETTNKPTIYSAGSDYTVTSDITLYALYSRNEAGDTSNSTDFEFYSGDLVEGDYVIVCSNKIVAMKAEVYNNRINYDPSITIEDNKVISPEESLVWHIAPSGDSWTIYNTSVGKYAASSGVKNNATLTSTVDDSILWTASGTGYYEFVNVSNDDNDINATLRYNPNYGFACYSTTTGASLNLYRRASGTVYYFTIENDDSGETFTIDAVSNNDSYGLVETNGNVITATPAAGYEVSGYEILSGAATVSQNGNTFTVTATSDVIVQINFAAIATHTVTYVENGVVISKIKVEDGETITLPETPGTVGTGETFEGWVLKDSTDIITEYIVTEDITFYAKYKETESGGTTVGGSYFEKITSDGDITSGDYLIVYESGSVAFDGSRTTLDAVKNTVSVSIVNDQIEATDSLKTAIFTIDATAKTIKSYSGYYIGQSSNANGLKSSTSTKYNHTITLNSDLSINLVSGGAYLRFNANSDQMRFRYYKSGSYTGQKAITLYKLVEGSASGSTEPTAEIKGAQVEVGEDLAINYYVEIKNAEDLSEKDIVMEFTLDNKTASVQWNKSNIVDNYYVFKFDQIPPQCMADTINAKLYVGDAEPISLDYSIQQNAKNLLATYSNDEVLKQFIADMLYYGEASQLYKNYKTENLAATNIGVSLNPQSTNSPVAPEFVATPQTSPDVTVGDVYFTSATVWFDTTNSIIVKVNSTENATLKVNGNEVEFDGKQFKTDAILATDFGDIYIFELYDGNTLVQTLEYSIDAYAYAKYNNGKTQEMKDLAKALYNYGKSAEAYAAAIA